MPPRIGNIALGCDDVLEVARFWSAALDRRLDLASDSEFASIGGDDAGRSEPAWYFEKVPDTNVAKNRMRIDLVDPDPASVQRLESLGASVIARHQIGGGRHRWTVMQDPEGKEFCIAEEALTG